MLKLPVIFVSFILHKKRADSKLKFQSSFYFASFDNVRNTNVLFYTVLILMFKSWSVIAIEA